MIVNAISAGGKAITLTLSTLWAHSTEDELMIFFVFFQKIRFDISCKLSPQEAICMKCRILFSGKNISKCRLLKFYRACLALRHYFYFMIWTTPFPC